jgi:hypothetical protein
MQTSMNQQSTGMQITLYTKNSVYHTIAVYWTRFLAGEVDTCEYSVTTQMRAIEDPRVRQVFI